MPVLLLVVIAFFVLMVMPVIWEAKVQEWHDRNPDDDRSELPFWVRLYEYFNS